MSALILVSTGTVEDARVGWTLRKLLAGLAPPIGEGGDSLSLNGLDTSDDETLVERASFDVEEAAPESTFLATVGLFLYSCKVTVSGIPWMAQRKKKKKGGQNTHESATRLHSYIAVGVGLVPRY